MKPLLVLVLVTVAALLPACGTKTSLALPPGPAKPPLFGGPVAAPPAAARSPSAAAADDSAPADKR